MVYDARVTTGRPETEVWFRNPGYVGIQLAEVGYFNVSFDEKYLQNRHLEAVPWCNMRFGANNLWRCLVICRDKAILYEAGDVEAKAVYPIWSAARHTERQLANLIKRPWSSNKKYFGDETVGSTWKAVPGQAHVIVITDLPTMNSPRDRLFMNELSDFQVEHPEVTFFIHGMNSYGVCFGNNFKMVDLDVRHPAACGEIVVPGGARVQPIDLRGRTYWAQILGFNLTDLRDPANRCKYNIKSALYAGQYFKTLSRMGIQKRTGGWDFDTKEVKKFIYENSVVLIGKVPPRPGDRVVCNDCSLFLTCKYYREDAVCAVEKTEMRMVSELIGTRDSESIQKALAMMVQANTDRVERGMKAESTPVPDDDPNKPGQDKPIDPNLTKLITDTFKMADRLLQIVDPTQRPGKPAVNVAINGTGQHVEITDGGTRDEQADVSAIIGMLEARGIKREDITPEMVNMALMQYSSSKPQKAITGEVVP